MGTERQPSEPYVPNKFSRSELCFCTACAVVLFGYGLYSFLEGRLVLPARAGGFAVSGYLPTGLFFLGALSWAVGFLAVVVDHYDERNNEHLYDAFERWTHRVGLGLMGAGIGIGALAARLGL